MNFSNAFHAISFFKKETPEQIIQRAGFELRGDGDDCRYMYSFLGKTKKEVSNIMSALESLGVTVSDTWLRGEKRIYVDGFSCPSHVDGESNSGFTLIQRLLNETSPPNERPGPSRGGLRLVLDRNHHPAGSF